MSHELRTPLNAIIGFSEALIDQIGDDVSAKQAKYLRGILSSGHHLLSVINDILDMSKVEAGRMELEVSRFWLPATIDEAAMLVREEASRRAIALDVEVGSDVGFIEADERKVKQVLCNLLSNAVKFTGAGGDILVRASGVDDQVEIAVQDSGIGIALEDQEAVFEEFYQARAGVTTAAPGTGLGLPLARRFVELHGGRLRLESQPGKGSTFTVTLPRGPHSGPAIPGEAPLAVDARA
jgi:signal transduction histidine kinase